MTATASGAVPPRVRRCGATVAAAALAVALAAAAVRTWWAESAYSEGLGATDAPAEDLPGRLAWYDEARRRDPGEPLYSLRAGQIRLGRAESAGDPPRRREGLLAAEPLLRESVRLFPLDSQSRASWAQALAGLGDLDGAIREADAALLLGPRRPRTYEWATRWFARRWDRFRDERCLVRLFRTAMRAEEAVRDPPLGVPDLDPPGAGTFRRFLESSDAPTAEDVIRSAGDEPDVLRFAAERMRAHRPLDADRIDAHAARSAPGPR